MRAWRRDRLHWVQCGSWSNLLRFEAAIFPLALVAERALAVLAVLWLQLVGVVTDSVLHHVLHAVPIAVLVVLRRTPWVRHTAVLAGLAWIVMLALITPMIHLTLTAGISFTEGRRAYTWLAPGMVVICIAWSATNIAILTDRPRQWFAWVLGLAASTLILAVAQPQASLLFEVPLERVLAGHVAYLGVLLIEVPLVLGLPWMALHRMARPIRPRVTPRSLCAQVAYWVMFVVCMVTGLLPAVN